LAIIFRPAISTFQERDVLLLLLLFLWGPSAYASGSTSALWLIVLSPYKDSDGGCCKLENRSGLRRRLNTPHLKEFPATLLACGETEVNHDASRFSLLIIRQSFGSGFFRIKPTALLL
jgi:hypothetical protein